MENKIEKSADYSNTSLSILCASILFFLSSFLPFFIKFPPSPSLSLSVFLPLSLSLSLSFSLSAPSLLPLCVPFTSFLRSFYLLPLFIYLSITLTLFLTLSTFLKLSLSLLRLRLWTSLSPIIFSIFRRRIRCEKYGGLRNRFLLPLKLAWK